MKNIYSRFLISVISIFCLGACLNYPGPIQKNCPDYREGIEPISQEAETYLRQADEVLLLDKEEFRFKGLVVFNLHQ